MVFLLPVMFGLGALSGLALVGTLGGGQYTGMEFSQLLQKIHHISTDRSWRILHLALGSGLLTGLLVGVPLGFIFAPIVGLLAGAPVGLAVGLCAGAGAALRQVARSMTHRQSGVVPPSLER
jgi:F0F1-type ATP synthase assembly protein I